MIDEKKLINTFKKVGKEIEELKNQITGINIYARNPPKELIEGLEKINEKLGELVKKK